MAEFTATEVKAINEAWTALEYCAQVHHTVERELADALQYETGSKTAGRLKIWAKALIVDAYIEGRYGSSEERRKWLYGALRISRGIRYGYMLGCSAEFKTEMEKHIDLIAKCEKAVAIYNDCIQRRAAA